MTRVIHTADTHIGYRQYHSDARRRDFLAAFERVVEDAIEAEVAAVVHAGDLFHDKRPDLRDLQGTVAALARLRDAEIPFLGIVGNHERKRDGQWLDLFEDLGLAIRLSDRATTIDDVAFYGLDYASPAERERLGVSFQPEQTARTSILVAHGIVEGLPHGTWSVDSLLETSSVAFDAVLLGDYHEHETIHRDGVTLTYPGSTERTSADEAAARGYNLIEIDEDGVSVTHRSLGETRPFRFVEVDLAPNEGIERVRERLDEHPLDESVVIVTLTGEGEEVAPAAIEQYALDAGALVARVRDRRETEATDDEVAVHFGDPDVAVRRALEERPLSEAGRAIDDVVRDLEVPDSRVRERVRARVQELVDEDPETLVPPGAAPEAADEEPEATEEADEIAEAFAGAGQASMEDYL